MGTFSSIMLAEHENILKATNAIEKSIRALEQGAPLDVGFFQKVLTFLRGYADHLHHAKEEDVLFRQVNTEENLKDDEEIKRLVHQHIMSRRLFEDIEEDMVTCNASGVVNKFTIYLDMIRAHIKDEDEYFFPILEQRLPEASKEIILAGFKEADTKRDIESFLVLLKNIETHASEL